MFYNTQDITPTCLPYIFTCVHACNNESTLYPNKKWKDIFIKLIIMMIRKCNMPEC